MCFGCKNQIMVAVMKRFESGPIKSRVFAFSDVFGVTNGSFKGTESRMNQGLDLDLRLENLVIIGAYLSSREDRVVLYAIRREPSDLGGLVMSREHCRSARKELISTE